MFYITIVATTKKETGYLSRFEKNIRITYSRMHECVTTVRYRGIKIPSTKAITDHYHDLLQFTSRYRGVPYHKTSGYAGPWIENYFIDTFMNKNITYFNGFVPLFVQWTDYEVLYKYEYKNTTSWTKMFQPLLSKLRTDMVYIIISQHNVGLRPINEQFPNAIVFSAGGDGHIPLPLIKGDISYIEPPAYENMTIDLSFYGSINHGHGRAAMITELETALKKKKFANVRNIFTASKQWIQNV